MSLIVCVNVYAMVGFGWYTTVYNNTNETATINPAGCDNWDQYDLDHAPLYIMPHQSFRFYTESTHDSGTSAIQGFNINSNHVELIQNDHDHSTFNNQVSDDGSKNYVGSVTDKVQVNRVRSDGNTFFVDLTLNP